MGPIDPPCLPRLPGPPFHYNPVQKTESPPSLVDFYDRENEIGKALAVAFKNLRHFLSLGTAHGKLLTAGLVAVLSLMLVSFLVRLPAILQSIQTEKQEKALSGPTLRAVAKLPGKNKWQAFFGGPPEGSDHFLDPDVWLETPRVYQLDDGTIVRIEGDNVEFLFSHGYWAGLIHGPSFGVILAAGIAIFIGLFLRYLAPRRTGSNQGR